MKILFKSLKQYAPKSLLGRIVLILIIPTVLAQGVSIYIFYERHMGQVSKQLALSLSAEVATVVDNMKAAKTPEEQQDYLKRAVTLFGFSPKLMSTSQSKEHTQSLKKVSYQPYEQQLKARLKNQFEMFSDDDKVVTTIVYMGQNVLVVDAPYKRLINSTSYIFILWMLGTTTLLLLISLIFLKNQIRPVVRLARLADNFGRGNDVVNYKPEGAHEVRMAYKAFINMHQRISRFVRQRTEMLAGISHDLRTPLTRMKLELALNKDSELSRELEKDIGELEHMINSYIEFVRGDEGEETTQQDIAQLLDEVCSRYKDGNIELKSEKIISYVRAHSLKRAFNNVIENALKYGKEVKIKAYTSAEFAFIEFEDKGPGIPEEKREEVFKPFFRIEESRNSETGGIGLGLSIVRDIVNSHGGTVTLEDAQTCGLKLVIKLPV